MVSLVIVGIFIATVLYQTYKFCIHRPPGFPPGPFRLPFVGSYFLLLLIDRKNLHLAVQKLCNYYKSSVLGFYVGGSLTVTVNDQKGIREMFANQDIDGRNGNFLIARLREPNYKLHGIFFTDGDYWNDQRRFALRNLRDFGFGRRFEDFELEVRDELESFVAMIKEGPQYEHERKFLRPGGELLLPKGLVGSLGNCFLQVVSGERIPRAQQTQLYKAGYGSLDFQRYSNEHGKLFGIIPSLRFLFPGMSDFKKLRENSMAMCDLMKTVVDQQLATYQDDHIRSFIDVYVKEINDTKAAGINTGYLYDQLLMICTDFVFPSLSAIETQIMFLLLHLLYRADICKKIQDEIDQIVGCGRLPGLDDRVNLPFTEATLREILRFETLVPSSVPHRATKDTTLSGYLIPKDTIVLPGLFALHNDEEVWGDPKVFRPERFLNDDGTLDLKKDQSLPFGAGRRLCAGETFARNTMFLCIAALLQNFNIKPANGKLPDLKAVDCGFARLPRDFWIKFESR